MVSRRGFLIGGAILGGGMIVGAALVPEHRRDKAISHVLNSDTESLLTTWLKIDSNNQITVYVPHSEMGQGVHTALPMMLADELDADWDLVQMERAPAVMAFANGPLAKGFLADTAGITIPLALNGIANFASMNMAEMMSLQITGGSTAIRYSGEFGMRVQGAAAKQMLLEAAAKQLSVDISELTAANSFITHAASGQKLSYGELAQYAAEFDVPSNPRLKQRSEFTIMGQSKPRFDIPGKVDGSAEYGIDVYLPNMSFAAVKASPEFGATVTSMDDSQVKDLPGIQQVIKLENSVVVVADSYYQAKQAVAQVKVTFSKTDNSQLSSENVFDQYAADLDAVDELGQDDVISGDAPGVLASATKTFTAEYKVPYLAHAAMEPVNSTVWIKSDGSVEFWAGLQDALGAKAMLSELLQVPMDQITAHHRAMGGAFGRRGSTLNFLQQTALVAQQVDGPVKLIWTREEDMQQDYYRPAISSKFAAALDDNNEPLAWINAYIGKNEPAEAAHIPYSVPNQSIRFVESETSIPFGPWRSVAHSQHGFFTESFIDELANQVNVDPYQYRRSLLTTSARHLKVLDTVAKKADWDAPLPENWGRGIALQSSFSSVVAQVVEVSVVDGKVKTERVVCVVDCGFAINPDNVVSQMESGIIYGLTAALYGDISIKHGAVQQSNFHDYEMLRMDETPIIETHILSSDNPLGGVGEPGTPAIAPALTNAIFNATGTRIRSLPVKHFDLAYKGEPELG